MLDSWREGEYPKGMHDIEGDSIPWVVQLYGKES